MQETRELCVPAWNRSIMSWLIRSEGVSVGIAKQKTVVKAGGKIGKVS